MKRTDGTKKRRGSDRFDRRGGGFGHHYVRS